MENSFIGVSNQAQNNGNVAILFIYFWFLFVFFLRFCLFVFGELGSEGEREGMKLCERNIDWLPLTCPQLGT